MPPRNVRSKPKPVPTDPLAQLAESLRATAGVDVQRQPDGKAREVGAVDIHTDKTTLEAIETSTDGTQRTVRATRVQVSVSILNPEALARAIRSLIDRFLGWF